MEVDGDTCSYCARVHRKSDCPVLQGPPQCVNDGLADMETDRHNAFDSWCPIMKRWEEIARSSVAYS